MRDELTRRGENSMVIYELNRRDENGITGIAFCNGRVIRLSHANIKGPDILYKSIGAFIF